MKVVNHSSKWLLQSYYYCSGFKWHLNCDFARSLKLYLGSRSVHCARGGGVPPHAPYSGLMIFFCHQAFWGRELRRSSLQGGLHRGDLGCPGAEVVTQRPEPSDHDSSSTDLDRCLNSKGEDGHCVLQGRGLAQYDLSGQVLKVKLFANRTPTRRVKDNLD